MLFDFKLRHVSAKDHAPADGLSRRRRTSEDSDDDEDTDAWIDEACGFSMECMNGRTKYQFLPDSYEKSYGETFSITMNTNYQEWISERKDSEGQSRSSKHSTVLVSEILKIPRSEKAERRDGQLKIIEDFLRDPTRPSAIPKIDRNKFLKSVSELFVMDNRLWRKDRQGRHKLVVWGDRRFVLIKEAHDLLGHKGV